MAGEGIQAVDTVADQVGNLQACIQMLVGFFAGEEKPEKPMGLGLDGAVLHLVCLDKSLPCKGNGSFLVTGTGGFGDPIEKGAC